MKNKIMNKLRSEKGASITFALLLFLVCAVLCSVILAAATAAAGRMSKLPEQDQRYYTVTSAAELIIDDIKSRPSVSIVKVTKTTTTNTYKLGSITGTETTGPEELIFFVNDKKPAEIIGILDTYDPFDTNLDSTNDPLYKYRVGNVEYNNFQKDAAKEYYDGITNPINRELLLTPSGSGVDNILKVDITEKIESDGKITFKLVNKNNSKGEASQNGEKYTMNLFFDVDRTENNGKRTAETSKTEDDGSLKVTTTEFKITITTLMWSLTDITVSA